MTMAMVTATTAWGSFSIQQQQPQQQQKAQAGYAEVAENPPTKAQGDGWAAIDHIPMEDLACTPLQTQDVPPQCRKDHAAAYTSVERIHWSQAKEDRDPEVEEGTSCSADSQKAENARQGSAMHGALEE
jgi:hypothetical protein